MKTIIGILSLVASVNAMALDTYQSLYGDQSLYGNTSRFETNNGRGYSNDGTEYVRRGNTYYGDDGSRVTRSGPDTYYSSPRGDRTRCVATYTQISCD